MTADHVKTHSLRPYLFVLAGVVLWSTGGLFIKYTTLDAVTVNFGRSLFAAVAVGLFTYKKGLRPDLFTLFSSFLYAATLSCFVYANKNTTAANAIFLQYTAPIYILILSPFVLHEKFRFRDAVTVALCLAGMSLFFADSGAAQATAPNVFAGNIAALVSGIFFGLYILFLSHPSIRSGDNPQSRNPAITVFYGNLMIVVLMLPLVVGSFSGGQTLRLQDVMAVAYLGIFQIGVAYLLFTTGIAEGVRSMDASLIGFIEPLLNPVWVVIFVGEQPSRWAVLGGAIIVVTILIHTMGQYRQHTSARREAAK